MGITTHSETAALMAMDLYDFETLMIPSNWQMNMGIGYGTAGIAKAKEKGMGILGMKSMAERGFHPGLADDVYRKKWPKAWVRLFDEQTQPEYLMAAMHYAVAQGIDTLIPAGDAAHFRFAVEHVREIWDTPISEQETAMLKALLPEVMDCLFIPEYDR